MIFYSLVSGIACLLNRINKPDVTVGVDGSLFKYHPHFKNIMKKKIQELAPDTQVSIPRCTSYLNFMIS